MTEPQVSRANDESQQIPSEFYRTEVSGEMYSNFSDQTPNGFPVDGRAYDVSRSHDMGMSYHARDPYGSMRRVPYERVKNAQFYSAPNPAYYRCASFSSDFLVFLSLLSFPF